MKITVKKVITLDSLVVQNEENIDRLKEYKDELYQLKKVLTGNDVVTIEEDLTELDKTVSKDESDHSEEEGTLGIIKSQLDDFSDTLKSIRIVLDVLNKIILEDDIED